MKAFQKFVFLSILGTYLVIGAGAIVRGTGSGLGCPDWPRCFGQWIPPTDISELPSNYKELYKISGKTIADFDAFKTWTEYINRLAGVFLGFLIIIVFSLSFGVRRLDKRLPWFCAGLLVLIMIQGGVGAIVVSTHLKPFIITIHMFLAIVLLFGLIYLRKHGKNLQSNSLNQPVEDKIQRVTKALVLLVFLQILLGTQVRQKVDHYIRDTFRATPETIMDFMGPIFYVHRSLSLLIVLLLVYLLAYFQKNAFHKRTFFLLCVSSLGVLANIMSGVALNYFNFPASAQPPHLFFGILTLGILYGVLLDIKDQKRIRA